MTRSAGEYLDTCQPPCADGQKDCYNDWEILPAACPWQARCLACIGTPEPVSGIDTVEDDQSAAHDRGQSCERPYGSPRSGARAPFHDDRANETPIRPARVRGPVSRQSPLRGPLPQGFRNRRTAGGRLQAQQPIARHRLHACERRPSCLGASSTNDQLLDHMWSAWNTFPFIEQHQVSGHDFVRSNGACLAVAETRAVGAPSIRSAASAFRFVGR